VAQELERTVPKGEPYTEKSVSSNLFHVASKFHQNSFVMTNTQDKLEVLMVVHMTMFWVVTP
jgi:hypothetical protein